MKDNFYLFFFLFLVSCAAEEKSELPFANGAIPVTVMTVKQIESRDSIVTTGLVGTDQSTKYAFKIGGVIDRIYFDEGDRVKKGDLLATLSLTEIDAQLNQADLGLIKAERDFARVSNLYADSIATLENFQDVKTQLEIAKEVKQQVAFNKKYARIFAASNGYIIQKLANKGEVIGPGTPFLLTNDASGNQGWQITCTLNGREWATVKKGAKCQVTIDAYPDVVIAGKVADKGVQAEAVSGAFKVNIDLSPRSIELASGMYGTAIINSELRDSTVTIPFEALTEANGNEGFVYLPKSDTTVIKRKIRITGYDNERITVSSGLKSGDEIILSNSPFLNEYSVIKIID